MYIYICVCVCMCVVLRESTCVLNVATSSIVGICSTKGSRRATIGIERRITLLHTSIDTEHGPSQSHRPTKHLVPLASPSHKSAHKWLGVHHVNNFSPNPHQGTAIVRVMQGHKHLVSKNRALVLSSLLLRRTWNFVAPTPPAWLDHAHSLRPMVRLIGGTSNYSLIPLQLGEFV